MDDLPLKTQRFRLTEHDGRELEFDVPASSVFPYAAMKQITKDHKFVMYRIELVQ